MDKQNFVTEIREVTAEAGGLGVLYWAPEWISVGMYGTKWENVALFDFNGKATAFAQGHGKEPRLESVHPHRRPPASSTSVGEWRGVDVSHLLQVEKGGGWFLNKQGKNDDLPKILADQGVNVARIRLLHNPESYNCCDLDQALTIAKRMDDVGIGVMIDFHYSDEWASGNRQTKPEAWRNMNFRDLENAVKTYTKDVMNAFYRKGIYPVGVQIGNEVR